MYKEVRNIHCEISEKYTFGKKFEGSITIASVFQERKVVFIKNHDNSKLVVNSQLLHSVILYVVPEVYNKLIP